MNDSDHELHKKKKVLKIELSTSTTNFDIIGKNIQPTRRCYCKFYEWAKLDTQQNTILLINLYNHITTIIMPLQLYTFNAYIMFIISDFAT